MMFERLVMDAVNAVAFPLYAKEMRDGNDVSSTFLRAAALITALGWSFLVCLAVLAFPLVRVLYGDQWDAAVDPTRWLAAAMICAVPVHVCMVPMLATGAVRQVLQVAIISTCISVASAGIGAAFGLLALSQLLLPAAAGSSLLWLYAAKRHVAFKWRDLLGIFVRSALCATAAGAVPLLVSLALGWRSTEFLTTLLVAVPGAAVGFAGAAYLTRHPVWDEAMRALGLRRA
jgi:O-antigen/teichoic acid export membrane protein